METTIKGVEEFILKLAKLDQEMQAKVFPKAAKAGGKVILDAALPLAPVVSGLLKANVRQRSASRPSKGIWRSSVGIGSKDWTGQAWYGGAVIWGHHAGSRKLGNARKWIPGDDFLKAAAEEAGDQALKAMTDVIAEAVKD